MVHIVRAVWREVDKIEESLSANESYYKQSFVALLYR